MPIYALTAQTGTRYRVSLFRDVQPITVSYQGHDRDALLDRLVTFICAGFGV